MSDEPWTICCKCPKCEYEFPLGDVYDGCPKCGTPMISVVKSEDELVNPPKTVIK